MSRYTTFKARNVRAKQRNVLHVNSFGGVDYSPHRFNIKPHRAIDLKNFYYKDGVIQKRQGYETLFKVAAIDYYRKPFANEPETITETSFKNDINFNGMWKFKAKDEKEHYIAHIGKLLFEIKNINNDENLIITPLATEKKEGLPRVYEYENYKSVAFVGDNKLWFLGGNKFMVLTFAKDTSNLIIEPVDESMETYIPNTTAAITYNDADIAGVRYNNEFPNLLTMWRTNTLLSGVGKQESLQQRSEYFEYVLDAPIRTKNLKDELEKKQLSDATKKALSGIRITIKERGEM